MGWRNWVYVSHRICTIRRDWWAPSWLAAIGLRSRVYGIAGPDGRVLRCGRTAILWSVPSWLLRAMFRIGVWRPEAD